MVQSKQQSVNSRERRENCGTMTWIQGAEDGNARFGPLFCESWNCPACRQVKIHRLIEKLNEADVCQYHEIELPHRWSEVKTSWDRILKRWGRAYGKVEYFVAIRSRRHNCTVGLFLASGTIPERVVVEAFGVEGYKAQDTSETLYRPEGRREKLVSLLDTWSDSTQFIHRVRHSRFFFVSRTATPPSPGNHPVIVSRAPLDHWMRMFERYGCSVTQSGPDCYEAQGGSWIVADLVSPDGRSSESALHSMSNR